MCIRDSFATITKHSGVLYLLVTDLGYANVSDIVWEKLDVIDGDTEYVNHAFAKPPPQTQLLPTGPVLSPEQLIAQQGQSEVDFQLALQLSQQGGTGQAPRAATDESKLIAAATEASLREYNGIDSAVAGGAGAPPMGGTVVALPPPGEEMGSSAPTAVGTHPAAVAAASAAADPALVAAAAESTQESADLFLSLIHI